MTDESTATTCKHSIYDPAGLTRACVLPLDHEGQCEPEAGQRCSICHELGGHTLSCPTRWYS